MCRKMDETIFTETVFPFNLYFQHIGHNLQEIQAHHSKER
jgi:hypothetical protein